MVQKDRCAIKFELPVIKKTRAQFHHSMGVQEEVVSWTKGLPRLSELGIPSAASAERME